MRHALPILLLALGACGSAADTGADGAAEAASGPIAAARAVTPVPVTPTIRFLELAGDMTLSEAERAQIVALERRERATDAAAGDKEDAELNAVLAKHAKATPVQQAKLRHVLRATLHYNRAKLTDPLPGELLAKHDPVLVEDTARKEIVSMADIRALNASNRYIAKIVGTAVPDMTEKPGERAELQRRYLADGSLRTALTHAGPRHAAMVAAIDGLPPAKRAEIDRILKEQVHTPEDAANAARGAENAVVLAEQRKAQRARDSAALADFKQWIWQRNQVTLEMARLDGMMRVLNTENLTYPK